MPAPAEREGGPATARIEYQTDQELVADYLENLSQGGAFVRTARPAPIGSRLTLEMSLPGGLSLQALSTVVFADEKGMGVKFDLDARGEGILATAIARITGRPRRALVVEGDAGARAALSEALSTRGFEVLTAENGERGLHVLAEEVLTLDLLVTGLELPGMRGEALIRAIRLAGGESDLAIAAVADDVDEAKERRLKDGGADAIFDRSLGAEKLAESVDGLIEKKRLAQKG
jgi:CheY-like chemotaxis protein